MYILYSLGLLECDHEGLTRHRLMVTDVRAVKAAFTSSIHRVQVGGDGVNDGPRGGRASS